MTDSHKSVVSGSITAGVPGPVVGSSWLLWDGTIDEVSNGREDATPHGLLASLVRGAATPCIGLTSLVGVVCAGL